jgi:hypothetical protein
VAQFNPIRRGFNNEGLIAYEMHISDYNGLINYTFIESLYRNAYKVPVKLRKLTLNLDGEAHELKNFLKIIDVLVQHSFDVTINSINCSEYTGDAERERLIQELVKYRVKNVKDARIIKSSASNIMHI